MSGKQPTILVFDSGVGGLTVLGPIRQARPDAHFVYVGDTACFPYGELPEQALINRVTTVIKSAAERFKPDLIVIACHTASTLVLPELRARLAIPIIGTVPAIKPAAEQSKSKLISVLATPGTVKRDYTAGLIRDYAGDCEVTLVSARHLASHAEAVLRGEKVDDATIFEEIASAFVRKGDRKTDCIVLACTHYPLLLDVFERVAAWPVTWIDPAPAIARRVVQLIGEPVSDTHAPEAGIALLTRESDWTAPLKRAFTAYGLECLLTTSPMDGK